MQGYLLTTFNYDRRRIFCLNLKMNKMNIICFFKGHKPEPFLTEKEIYFMFSRCKRCKLMLGMPKWKRHNVPPPNSTPEQVLSWEAFCEENYQSIRDSFK
jgi:hypothetical protein